MSVPPCELGAVVYGARAWSYGDNRVPCPVCYGKLCVVIELGNGERLTVECDGCGLGFDGPQGTINEPCAGSRVERHVVSGVQETTMDGWRVLSDNAGWMVWGKDVFATEAEAEARRVVLLAEEVRAADNRVEQMRVAKRKSMTWAARYHLECLKKAERDVEYHRRKLSDARAKARDAKKTSA